MSEAKEQKLAKPTPEQVAWQDMEIGMFIHFGLSSWPAGQQQLENFNPIKLDTNQWAHAAELMGANYIAFTAKHGDGFCMWQMTEFMISFWGGPEDEASAKLMAEAGFNVVMCQSDKLELCRKYGLKAMLFDSSTELAFQLTEDTAVWGYYILDEPGSAEEFEELSLRVKAFRKADPNHPAYINLLSSGGDYLDDFMKTVRPDILSYDYYQWWWGSEAHFPKLEEYRAAALTTKTPLICWIEANADRNAEYNTPGYLPDNMVKLRQSVYTSLAYGIKGIQWFVGSLIFERDEATGTFKLTQAGKDVASINAELKRLGPILVQLGSTDVFHTRPLPSETRELPADYWIQTETPDLVLGMFQDDMKSDFILVVNRNYRQERQVVLRFLRPVLLVEKFDKQTGKWTTLPLDKVVKLVLGPADGELLKVSDSEAD